MKDKIVMSGMQFFGYHGVYAEENKLGQRFKVDLELYLPLQPAGQSDELKDTVNYGEVYETVRGLVEERTFQLIETVAEQIAVQVLECYSMVEEVIVRVHKPNPPFKVFFDGVTIEIHRKRA
ncbi:dihydroneopterin aldolase [Paenibacillus senegalensis]|uniref:dihydroneopterin aldolase n=1 Tax=Paenibacillus senegalensis TaxID=1465766 RepID=UPI000288D6A8